MTIHEPMNAREKNHSGDISSVPVNFKRDVIGTNRRVIGVVNDCVDEIFSDNGRSTRDTLVVNLEKFGSVLGRGVMPFITPELC